VLNRQKPIPETQIASISTNTDKEGSNTTVEAKERHTATIARASVTISAILASIIVTLVRPEAAPVFTSVAVGAISGFFAISRNNDKDTTT
jgi:hypothetical protein